MTVDDLLHVVARWCVRRLRARAERRLNGPFDQELSDKLDRLTVAGEALRSDEE